MCCNPARANLIGFGQHETEPASGVQGTTFRPGDYCALRALYLTYKLSSRDLVQMMAERGIEVTHTTILRWVQRFVPEFEKRWSQYSRPVGRSWRCDETYIKVKGRWTYLYRAVDKLGRTVDFLLRERRDVAAAKHFFNKAMKKHGTPRVITLDAYAPSHRAITEWQSAER